MATQAMAISKTGIALIQRFEGFRAEPARLPDGRHVVGFGHVQAAPDAMTRTEADEALRADLAPIVALLNQRVLAPLRQNQFDALASFAFSIGAEAFKRSDVLRNLNAGEPIAAACAFDAWRKSEALGDAQVIDVLVRRRAAEKALFLDAETLPAAPSAYLRPIIDHASAILAGAPIAVAPDLDAPAIVAGLAVDPVADRLVDILQSEPSTAMVLSGQPMADVLLLDTPVAEVCDLIAAPAAAIEAPMPASAPLEAAPEGRDEAETRAFLLLGATGLALIVMGAWALFSDAGQTAFLLFSAPGVVVTAMAGYHLAKALGGRRGQQLPTPAPAG
jgi:lysozyme